MTRTFLIHSSLFCFILFFSKPCFTQLSVSSLIEYQLGNIPNTEPDDLSNIYGQINLMYSRQNLSFGMRYENFNSSENPRSFDHLAQRYAEWQNGTFTIRAGNFYTTLGRGLLLRAFELPNVIFEQRQFRRRYSYYRDLDGFLAEAKWQNVELKVLSGKPLNNAFPPELDSFDRRNGTVRGGQIIIRPFQWFMIGDAFLHTSSGDRPDMDMNSLFGQWTLSKLLRQRGLTRATLKLYFEHARSNSNLDNFFSTSKKNPHATYVGLNFSYKKFGFSAELKDYRDFENGLNLPPILYKEHGYYLLNRSTHELLSDFERGYQVEISYRPTKNIFLVGNMSFAENDLSFRKVEFVDRFIEATIHWAEKLSTKTFYDWSKDEIKAEISRKTGGFDIEWALTRVYALNMEFQHQSIESQFGQTLKEQHQNSFSSLTFSRSPSFSVSLLVNRSTDPIETDDARTPFKIERDAKYWPGFAASLQINMAHEVNFFYGKRRGGLVCLSGTCYEVLPFEGLELRWVAHF